MRNLLSRNLLILTTLAFATTSGEYARGTDIVLNSGTELLGYQANYAAYGYNLNYPSSFLWEICESDEYASTGWFISSTTTANASLYSYIPGTFLVRLTVTYGSNSGGPGPANDVVVRTITISPPEAGPPLGTNVPTNYTVNEATSTSIQNCDGYYLFYQLMYLLAHI